MVILAGGFHALGLISSGDIALLCQLAVGLRDAECGRPQPWWLRSSAGNPPGLPCRARAGNQVREWRVGGVFVGQDGRNGAGADGSQSVPPVAVDGRQQ